MYSLNFSLQETNRADSIVLVHLQCVLSQVPALIRHSGRRLEEKDILRRQEEGTRIENVLWGQDKTGVKGEWLGACLARVESWSLS